MKEGVFKPNGEYQVLGYFLRLGVSIKSFMGRKLLETMSFLRLDGKSTTFDKILNNLESSLERGDREKLTGELKELEKFYQNEALGLHECGRLMVLFNLQCHYKPNALAELIGRELIQEERDVYYDYIIIKQNQR